jgi:hypothetical protein
MTIKMNGTKRVAAAKGGVTNRTERLREKNRFKWPLGKTLWRDGLQFAPELKDK